MNKGSKYNIKIKKAELKKTDLPVQIFDYQKEAIENLKILDTTYPDYYSTLVVIPTGGGKTRIAVEYLYQNVLNRKGHKVLWIAERLLLLEQAYSTFSILADKEHLKKKESEIITRLISSKHGNYKNTDFNTDVDLVIITQQTLEKKIDRKSEIVKAMEEWLTGAENLTIVIDEAHHALAEPYRAILLSLLKLKQQKIFETCHIIGLTATPKREGNDEIENIFSFGVWDSGDSHKVATAETSYAYQISIHDLVSKEVLSIPYMAQIGKRKNKEELSIPYMDQVDQGMNIEEAVLDIYMGGVEKLNFYDGQTGKSRQVDLEKSAETFGQTIVFAESRMYALKMERMFRESGIECGLAISLDGELTERFEKEYRESLEHFLGKSILEKKRQIKEDIKAYKSGNLQLIITVNMLMEGVDVPKTQTVFIAKRDIDDVEITQMVGRGLRGKFQGGTPTAFIVNFCRDNLEKILWETPESYCKDRKEKELSGKIVLSKENELKDVDVEALLLKESDFINWQQGVNDASGILEVKAEDIDSDARIVRRENVLIKNVLINQTGLLPKGYYLLGKKALLIWNGMEIWVEEIRKSIDVYGVDEEFLRTKESFHVKARAIIEKNALLEEGENNIKGFLPPDIIEVYLRHFLLFFMIQCGQSKDTFLKTAKFIEFKHLNQYELSDVLRQSIDKSPEEFDGFIEEIWDNGHDDMKKAWHDKDTFKCFLKPKLYAFHKIKIKQEEDIDTSTDEYFHVRLYREGRKRRDLCEMLKQILLNVPEKSFRFVDVFGGTGTVTAQMMGVFKERVYNDVDTNLANFIYCVSDEVLGKKFDRFCYERVGELSLTDDNEKLISRGKYIIEQIKQDIGLQDEDIMKLHELDEIVAGKVTNLENNALEKKKEGIQAFNKEVESYKTGGMSKLQREKFKQRRSYLLSRYKQLTKEKAMLEDSETKEQVKRYLAFYYVAGWETDKLVSDDKIRDEVNKKVSLDCYNEAMERAFHFLFSRGFSSQRASGTSVTGIDSSGIQRFNNSLDWKKGTSWLTEFHDRMQGVKVWSKDFMEILRLYEREETVYYLDPPYFLTCQYDAGFPDEYHLKMLDWLRTTTSKWVLSCKDSGTNKLEVSNWKSRIGETKELIYVENVADENPKLDEYLKLFLYPKIEIEEKGAYLKNVGCKAKISAVYKANVQPNLRRKDDLYVYKLSDEKHAEIMISNIRVKEIERKILRDKGIEMKDFEEYFGLI